MDLLEGERGDVEKWCREVSGLIKCGEKMMKEKVIRNNAQCGRE